MRANLDALRQCVFFTTKPVRALDVQLDIKRQKVRGKKIQLTGLTAAMKPPGQSSGFFSLNLFFCKRSRKGVRKKTERSGRKTTWQQNDCSVGMINDIALGARPLTPKHAGGWGGGGWGFDQENMGSGQER